MSDIAKTPQEAAPIYRAMAPEDQDAVRALVAGGTDRVRATNLVTSKRKQAKAADIGATSHQADVLTGGPTGGERNASFLEGLSDTLGLHLSPIANGAAEAATFPMDPLKAFEHGFAAQKANLKSAAEQAPKSFGGGQLVGDVANMPGAAAGGVGIKRAIEGIPAAIGGLTGLPARVVGAVKGITPAKAIRNAASSEGIGQGIAKTFQGILDPLLGEGGEVTKDAIVSTTRIPKVPSALDELLTDIGPRRPPPLAQPELPPDMAAPPSTEAPLPPRAPANTPMSQIPKPAPDVEKIVRSMPLAPPPAARVSATSINDEVRAAVAKGEPLKTLAARLKVPQMDLRTKYRAAQLGNLGAP